MPKLIAAGGNAFKEPRFVAEKGPVGTTEIGASVGPFISDAEAESHDGGPYVADLLVTVHETVVKGVPC